MLTVILSLHKEHESGTSQSIQKSCALLNWYHAIVTTVNYSEIQPHLLLASFARWDA